MLSKNIMMYKQISKIKEHNNRNRYIYEYIKLSEFVTRHIEQNTKILGKEKYEYDEAYGQKLANPLCNNGYRYIA